MLFEKQVQKMFRDQFLIRCDDVGTAYYFSAADFPGLQLEGFAFPSSAGHSLQGYFYCYENPVPGRIIVFDHGFGGGHRSYMKEIELLCRRGFLVFSYDHTGCMESGGKDINGLSQSLRDLNDCLTALKASPKCQGMDISVMGHSWGGFSTLNIAALHPDVSRVVVLSGFLSVEVLIGQFFSGIMKPYRKGLVDMDKASNPDFWHYNALDSLAGTNAKVLLVYSSNDPMVKKEVHFDALQTALAGKENVRCLLVENRGHNPNYTADAVKYLGIYSEALTSKRKKKLLETDEQKAAFVASWDWNRMTAQDEAVWEEIYKALE